MHWMRNAAGLLCLFFAACSSGGGGAPSLPPNPRQMDPPDLEARQQRFASSAEFTRQPALAHIGAGYAYARGATGEGETLVIVDNGLQANHREFAGKQVQISGHPDSPGYRATIAQSGHGTASAGVAAARRDLDSTVSGNMHGVAFDADVHMVNIPLGSPAPTYDPVALATLRNVDSYWESLFGYAAGLGPIVNLSLGYAGAISEPAYTRAGVRAALERAAAAMAQSGTPNAEKSIFVWAAGNAGREFTASGEAALADAPEILGGLGVHFPELRSHVLTVVALGDRPGTSGQLEIAGFSNHCGIARDFCIAAPGVRLTVPVADASRMDRYRSSFSGTSAAAPVVSGALALLRHFFRNADGSYALGNTELVARLLETADRSGVFANSDIYGRGKLDLDAATRPSGAARLLLGATLAGPAAPESLSALTPGAAFGDALSSALARREVAAFDALDAPFRRSLASYLPAQAVGARQSLAERLRALGGDPRGAALATAAGGVLRLHASRAPGADAAGAANALRSAGAPPLPQPGDVASAATPSAAQLDSLWLSQPLGARGAGVFLGLRGHPGWDFGLHAAGAISPGQFSDSGAFANPYLAFARAGGVAGVAAPAAGGVLRAAAFRGGAQWGALRDPDAAQAFGGVLEFQAGGRARGAAFSAGLLREPERLAGSRLRGAFGGGGGRSWFAGASAHWPLAGARGGLRGFASLHAGYTRAAPRAGASQSAMLSWQAPLWSSAWAVGVSRRAVLAQRDQLSLRLSQPLRVERGRAALRWVSGRNGNGSLHIERAELPLSPSGRQLEAELSYARDLAGGMLHISALGTRHPGHNASAAAEFSLLLRYALRF